MSIPSCALSPKMDTQYSVSILFSYNSFLHLNSSSSPLFSLLISRYELFDVNSSIVNIYMWVILYLINMKINGVSKGRHTMKGDTKLFNISELKNTFSLGCLINV